MKKNILLLILYSGVIFVLAQPKSDCYNSCNIPDTVYLSFEANDSLVIELEKEYKYFHFYLGHSEEIFRVKFSHNNQEMNDKILTNQSFYTLNELIQKRKQFLKCYTNSIKNNNTLYIHDNDDIFKTIIITEKKGDKYFRHIASWLDIEE